MKVLNKLNLLITPTLIRPTTGDIVIATKQQYIKHEVTLNMDPNQILDLIQPPTDYTVEAVLLGQQSPANDYNGLFIHFTPLDPSKLTSFLKWGRDADVLIEFYDMDLADNLACEIKRRWPESDVYDFGCLCCDSAPPWAYRLQ
jgi:hypothetical protein